MLGGPPGPVDDGRRMMDHTGHNVTSLLDALGLPVAMFVTGLVGSAMHCVGMCGPFVLAQTGARMAGHAGEYGDLRRLADGALAPYHLGRLTTYTALGGLAGALAGVFVAWSGFRIVLAALLVAAASWFVLHAVASGGSLLARVGIAGGLERRLSAITRPFASDPTGWRGYGLGVTLGFLPCGLIYGALAAAAGSGSAARGALAMAAFSLGTMPALIGIGVVGAAFGRQWREAARAWPARWTRMTASRPKSHATW